MGILRFFRWLDSQPKDFAELRPLYRRNRGEPEDGHVVLVDGFGFWITLIHLCTHPEKPDVQQALVFDPETHAALPLPAANDADLTGADLWVLEAAIRRIVTSLAENYGVKLVFLIDGERHTDSDGAEASKSQLSALADKTREKIRAERHKERLLAKLHTYDYCNGKTLRKARLQRDNRPAESMPPLAFQQFYHVLGRAVRSASDPAKPLAEVVQLQGEVDSEIAQLMAYYKAEFVLTGDSDFFVTPGIKAMVLNAFPFDLFVTQDASALPNPLPLSIYSCERFCQRLDLEPRQLALAATLTGNDMTRDLVDEGRLDEIIEKIKTRRQWNDPSIVDNPVVKASIDQYVGDGTPAHQQQALPPSMEPETRRVLDRVPRGLLPMTFYGRISEDVRPLCNAKFAYLTDFPTFARLRMVAAKLLGRNSLDVYRDGADTPETVVVTPPADLAALLSKAPPRNSAEAFAALKAIFTVPQSVSVSDASAKGQLFLAAVLWTLRPTLMGERELQLMALVVAVTAELSKVLSTDLAVASSDAVPSAKALGRALSLSTPRAIKDHPQARCMELADLFGSAFQAVEELFVLLDAWTEVPDSVANPSHVLSGSVLHFLARLVDDEKRLPFAMFEEAFLPTPKQRQDSASRPTRQRAAAEDLDAAKSAARAALDRAAQLLQAVPSAAAAGQQKNLAAFLDADTFHWRVSPLQERMTWAGLLLHDTAQKLEAVGTELDANTKIVPAGSPNSKRGAFPLIAATTNATTDESASRPILPTERHIDKVLANVRDHRVVCIQGDTGCGKSSIIPMHLLLEAERLGKDAFIVVTQPRRLAATSLAQRVASLLDEEVGVRVGYRLGGGVRQDPTNRSRCLIFVTTGYLLELLAHSGGEAFFERMTHLVLDEVHERSIDADMLGLVARLMMSQDGPSGEEGVNSLEQISTTARVAWWRTRSEEYRAGCTRLLIMSATINPKLFLGYYSALGWTPEAPVLQVGEKRFDVEEIYVDEFFRSIEKNHPGKVPRHIASELTQFVDGVSKIERAPSVNAKAMFAVCQFIYMSVQPGTCVLVFLPGLGEIEGVFGELENTKGGAPCRLRLHALHSVVPGEEQQAAMVPAAADECKVVLSTNIAETSLTIPDVKIVIDMGLSRHVFFDKKTNMRSLQLTRCSQAAARQRMGRSGRVSSGTVLRLYSRSVYDKMEPFDEPEIYPLEYSVLLVRECLAAFGGVREVMQQLIEPPPMAEVDKAIRRLIDWGALGPHPELETLRLGRVAVRLPVDVLTTRAILQAVSYGCVSDMVIIAAGLGLSRPLIRHQIRPFFDSPQEFQRACGESLAALGELDLGRRNDLFQFINIYEMMNLHKGFSRTDAFVQVQRYYLSPPQLKAFSSSVRTMAQSLLRLLDEYELTPQDAQNLALLAGQRTNNAAGGNAAGTKAPASRAVVTTMPAIDGATSTLDKKAAAGARRTPGKPNSDDATTAAAMTAAEDEAEPGRFRSAALHDPSAAYFLQLVLAGAADASIKVSYKAASASGVMGHPRTEQERRNMVRLRKIPAELLPPVTARDAETGVWEHSVTEAGSKGALVQTLRAFGPVVSLRSVVDDEGKSKPVVNKWKKMAQGGGDDNSGGSATGDRTVIIVFGDDPQFTLAMRDPVNRVMRHPTSVSPSVHALTHFASIAMLKTGGRFPFVIGTGTADALELPMPQTPAECQLAVIASDDNADDGGKPRKGGFRPDRWSVIGAESAARVTGAAAKSATQSEASLALCFKVMMTGSTYTAGHTMALYLPSRTLDVEDGAFSVLGALAARPPFENATASLQASFTQDMRMINDGSYNYEYFTSLQTLRYSRYPGFNIAELHHGFDQTTFILLLIELNALLALRVARNAVTRKDLRRLIAEVRRAATNGMPGRAQAARNGAGGGGAPVDDSAWATLTVQPEPWSSTEGERCLFFAWDLETLVEQLSARLNPEVGMRVRSFARIISADGFVRGTEAQTEARRLKAPPTTMRAVTVASAATAASTAAVHADPAATKFAPAQGGAGAIKDLFATLSEQDQVLLYATDLCLPDKVNSNVRWVSESRLYDRAQSSRFVTKLPLPLIPFATSLTEAHIEHALEQWARWGWLKAGPVRRGTGKPRPEKYFLTPLGDQMCKHAPVGIAGYGAGMGPVPQQQQHQQQQQQRAPLPTSVAAGHLSVRGAPTAASATAVSPTPAARGQALLSPMEWIVLYLMEYNVERTKRKKHPQSWVDADKLYQFMLVKDVRDSLPTELLAQVNPAAGFVDRENMTMRLVVAIERLSQSGLATMTTPSPQPRCVHYELTHEGAALVRLDRRERHSTPPVQQAAAPQKGRRAQGQPPHPSSGHVPSPQGAYGQAQAPPPRAYGQRRQQQQQQP